MTAPTLVILCGASFSGKSTYAAQLVANHAAYVVSLDAIMLSRGWQPGDGAPDSEWYAAHLEAKRLVEVAMQERKSLIVLDDTNCFRFLRDAFRNIADAHQYQTLLLTVRTPPEELERRRRQNELLPDRHSIREEVFQQHLQSFEWPTEEECPVDWETVVERLQ